VHWPLFEEGQYREAHIAATAATAPHRGPTTSHSLAPSTFVARAVSTALTRTMFKELSFTVFSVSSSPLWRVIELSISH
jgi:hypothetical protein